MSFIPKISEAFASNVEKLPNRFNQGFMKMGIVERTPRNNSTSEIIGSIQAYAKETPEIADFAKHLNELNPKHLGLAQDIIDLSKTKEMLPTHIDIAPKTDNGKSIVGMILNRLPEISKKNPAALDLTETVFNNSDTINSKYFLCKLFGFNLENMGSLSKQLNATKEIIPEIAQDTLDGGYTMDYSKNKEFFEFVKALSSEDAKPENVKMIRPIMNAINKLCKNCQPICDLNEIKTGDTKVIKKNMEALPYLLENAEAQKIPVDISGFLTKAPTVEA